MDIPITGPETARETLDQYQRRFLPESDSQLLRAQFACVVQLPNESVQTLHARMRVLYCILCTPTPPRGTTSSSLKGSSRPLSNGEVQNHVRRRKPLTYAVALAAANEETSFVLMDLATHAPGRVQAPTLGGHQLHCCLEGPTPQRQHQWCQHHREATMLLLRWGRSHP